MCLKIEKNYHYIHRIKMKGEIMIGNFNEEAQKALLNAKNEMMNLGHPYIGTEHLLLSILSGDSNISNRLSDYNLNYNNFKEELCKVLFIYTSS